MTDDGRQRQASECIALACLIDERRIPGQSVILSQDVAKRIQSALEDAAEAFYPGAWSLLPLGGAA